MLPHSAESSKDAGWVKISESAPIAPPTANSAAAISHVNLGDSSREPSGTTSSRADLPSPTDTAGRASAAGGSGRRVEGNPSAHRIAAAPSQGERVSETTKYRLPESAIPTHWVNLLARPPGNPVPPLHPGHQGAARSRRPRADLPDGPDRAGGLGGAGDRDPGGGPGDLQALAADAALPGAPPGAGARHPGPHLLQVRGGLARRLAQAEHGGRAGLLQQAGGIRKLPPRPAPASGARRSRSHAGCSAWSARSSWSGSATTRSPTAGR